MRCIKAFRANLGKFGQKIFCSLEKLPAATPVFYTCRQTDMSKTKCVETIFKLLMIFFLNLMNVFYSSHFLKKRGLSLDFVQGDTSLRGVF